MSLIALLASVATMGMFVSQLTVVSQLRKAKRRQTSVPILQFLISFLSSALWSKYGMLKHDPTILWVNGMGALIALYILACFWWYSPESHRSNVIRRCLATTILGIMSVVVVDCYKQDTRIVEVFSMACCVLSLLFLGSPLGQIGDVVRLRDASVLLPEVTALAFLNNVLWAAYGYLHQDPYMLVPNAIGVVLCFFQLALIAYYGRTSAHLPTVAKMEAVAAGDTVQMTEVLHSK